MLHILAYFPLIYAFCMTKIGKRKVQQHAFGAWSPWTKVVPNKL